MPVRYIAVLGDAWALFRRDGDLLVRVTGPFLFLPALALELLVPAPPLPQPRNAGTANADALAWADALAAWAHAHGGWYLLAYAVQVFGTGAVLALYLHAPRPDARGALARSVVLLPRLLLAALVVALPAGAGLLLWVLPGLYVLGRAIAAAPVLVAEAPTGALAAIARALRLSRGASLPLAAVAGTAVVGGYAAGLPFAVVGIDAARAGRTLLVAAAACGSAAVTALAALANALLAVAAYRALASRQGS